MKPSKMLLFLYLALILVQLLLSSFVITPTIYSDEYLYAKLARSLSQDFTYSIHGIAQNGYPPLYPLLLSFAYFFQDMNVVYFVMKSLNALVSSLIVFPMYFFARRFVSEKESLLLALLVGVLPATFAFTPYLMAENLFFVLFFTTVYFLFRSTTTGSISAYFLTGVFLALTLLTKVLGFLLLPLFVLLFFRGLYRKDLETVGLFLFSGLVAVLLYLPWFIYTVSHFGISASSLIGGSYETELTNVLHHSLFFFVKNSLSWLLVYLGAFVLSTGILFFLGAFFFSCSKRLSSQAKELLLFFSVLFTMVLLFVINHNLHGVVKVDTFLSLSGRPLLRYIDVLLPILLLVGYLGLKQRKHLMHKDFFFPSLLLLLSFPLSFYSLLPVNNLSLAWFGVLQYASRLLFSSMFVQILVYLIFAACFTGLIYLLVSTYSLRKVLSLFCVFFFFASVLSLGLTMYHSRYDFYPREQVQLGVWLGKHLPLDATVVVDSEACVSRSLENPDSLCSSTGHTTLLGFWVNRDIFIRATPTSGDYFISRKTLPYQPQYITENHIYVYKVN